MINMSNNYVKVTLHVGHNPLLLHDNYTATIEDY